MNTAKIDANTKSTWTALNETTGQIERVYCDPVTGALLVYAVVASGNAPTTRNNVKTDANDKGTQGALNETTGLVEALRCGNGGELLIKAM